MNQPNVLYIFADQMAMGALQTWGNARGANTPNIHLLAEKGVKFTASYCSTPQCSPSRSSIMTGMYPHKTGVIGNIGSKDTKPLSPEFETIGRFLRKKGYGTAYFGKWHLGTPLTELGFETFWKGEEHAVEGFANDDKAFDRFATDRMLEFLESRAGKSEPWFAMVSYNNPHYIYRVNKMKRNSFELDTDVARLPHNFDDDLLAKPNAQRQFRDADQGRELTAYTEEDWAYYVAYYHHLIEYIDKEVGTILEKLRATGQDENTLVIFTSDHGDMAGAHRLPFKGPMMYDELIKIPFVMSLPGYLPEGKTIGGMMINTDHFPTIVDLLGFDLPPELDGISHKRAILGDEEPSGRDRLVIQYYGKQKWINPIRAYIQGPYKYHLYLSGEEELYDTVNDPGELHNLAHSPQYSEEKSRLRGLLLEWMEEQRDPFFLYKNTELDRDPLVKKQGGIA